MMLTTPRASTGLVRLLRVHAVSHNSLDWHVRQAEFIVALPKEALREVLRKAAVLVAAGV